MGMHDECSHWEDVAFLATKTANENLSAITQFFNWLELNVICKVKRICIDGSKEFSMGCPSMVTVYTPRVVVL